MAKTKTKTKKDEIGDVMAQCGPCRGTGVYRGYAEPKGIGVVCGDCGGSGKKIIRYIPFTGRKTRKDVKFVRWSQGDFMATGAGPTGRRISYKSFLAGKMPAIPKKSRQ